MGTIQPLLLWTCHKKVENKSPYPFEEQDDPLIQKSFWKLYLLWILVFDDVRSSINSQHTFVPFRTIFLKEIKSLFHYKQFNLCFQKRTVITTHLIESKLQNNLQKNFIVCESFFFSRLCSTVDPWKCSFQMLCSCCCNFCKLTKEEGRIVSIKYRTSSRLLLQWKSLVHVKT